MAIALDRASTAIAERTDPTRRHLTDAGRRRARITMLAAFAAIAVIVLLAARSGRTRSTRVVRDRHLDLPGDDRGHAAERDPVFLDYVQDPDSFIFGITEPIGNFLLEYMLEPIRILLMESPWFIMLAWLTAIAFVLSGPRPAITPS